MTDDSGRTSPPRVLLIAEMANPDGTSVPLEGWSHAMALRGVCRAHVVTQVRHREAFLRHGLVEGRDFTAIDSERVARPFSILGRRIRGGTGKGWTTMMAMRMLPYLYFERQVWKRFVGELRTGCFDVVHRITPLSPTIPSPLARRCRKIGVPFVIGPLNGGVPWPAAFDRERRQEREWLSYIRGVYRLVPGYTATRRDSSALIIGSRDTLTQVPERYRDKCVYIAENGIDPSRFEARAEREPGRPLRAVFVGRLVPYKGPDMLIEAAAPLLRDGTLELDIIGDGPMMGSLKALVEREGVEASVNLAGQVPHTRIAETLGAADVMAFPSIREFGGAVALEAMAIGLPPIVVDYGGPAELVTPETGYLLPLGDRASIIAAMRSKLAELIADPSGLRQKGRAARRRAMGLFTWQAKARQVLEVYRWVLGDRRDKPDFGMPLSDEFISEPVGERGTARQRAHEVQAT